MIGDFTAKIIVNCRYRSAQKQATSGGSVTKMDGIKEELEEAQLKVDIARDSLAADIYTLLAKESEFAKVGSYKLKKKTNGALHVSIRLDDPPLGGVATELPPGSS